MTKIQIECIVFTLLGLFVIMRPAFSDPAVATGLAKYISARQPAAEDGIKIQYKNLAAFYKNRNYDPVWFTPNNKAKADLEKFNKALRTSAHENGLPSGLYNLEKIASDNSADYYKREILLTNAVMSYMQDLTAGQIDPAEYDSMIFMQPENQYLDVHMTNILKDWSPKSYLDKIEPQQDEYKMLKKALAAYRAIAKDGGWPKISQEDVILYPGEAHEIIPEIRARLKDKKYDGILPKDAWVDDGKIDSETLRSVVKNAPGPGMQNTQGIDPDFVYDSELAQKVAEFQYMHGKKTDGIIGPQTLKAMNASVEKRITQIKLALERWRWFPDNLGDKYILVNIAGYYARAVENHAPAFTMPIIVGEVAHQTPVFSSVIKNVKLHPDWIAPSSISRRYLIEKIQKDPSLISKLGYQIQSIADGKVETVPWENVSLGQLNDIDLSKYRFRQKPGKYNALGLARFSIENDYAIFMHGTPSGNLFNVDARTFSSGCIRVADPLKMAKFLLKERPDYDEKKLEDLYYLDENEHPGTTYLKLARDIPVYLTYATAWTDKSGNVSFSDDIYGRDEKLASVFLPSS